MKILLTICAFSAFIYSAICEPIPQPRRDTLLIAYGHTEVAFWRDGKLFFIDTHQQKLCSYHLEDRHIFCVTIGLGLLSFAVPVERHPKEFVVGCGNNILLIMWDSITNEQSPPHVVLHLVDHHIKGNRVNYGSVDHQGRLWLSTMNDDTNKNRGKMGSLFSLDANKNLARNLWELSSITGGFVWDPPRTEGSSPIGRVPYRFYLADTLNHVVALYDFRIRAGTIGRREDLSDLPFHKIPGDPGRIAIDTRGWLWVPLLGGNGVIEFDPFEDTVHRYIHIPARKVGACTFGGPEWNILFVSTIEYEHKNEERLQGDEGGYIYAIHNLNVTGVPTRAYKFNHYVMNPRLLHGQRRSVGGTHLPSTNIGPGKR